jgi:hypothetical protein
MHYRKAIANFAKMQATVQHQLTQTFETLLEEANAPL